MNFFSELLQAAAMSIIPYAYAYDPCTGVSSVMTCGAIPDFQGLIIIGLPSVFLSIAGGVSVLFVVWGGAQMMMNLGDEGTLTKGRVSIINGLIGFAIVLVSQSIVATVGRLAIGTASSNFIVLDIFKLGVRIITNIMNSVFAAVAVYSGFRLVIAHGQSDQMNKAKTAMIGAIAGAIVINVARSAVQALMNIL